MLRNIARYNELQSVLNEDLYGPLQNDSVIIVVQVSAANESEKMNETTIANFAVLKSLQRYTHESLIYGI